MKYLTKDEVAETLRVSVRTITDYMGKGLLPQPRKLGRRLLWSDAELFNWVDAMRKTETPTRRSVTQKRGRPRKVVGL